MNRILKNTSLVLISIAFTFLILAAVSEESYAFAKLGFKVSLPDKSKPAAVRCKWNSKVKNASYYVLKCTLNGKKVSSKKIYKKSGTFTYKKLKKNKRYEFRLYAYDKSGSYVGSNGRMMVTGLCAPDLDTWEYTEAFGDHINVAFYKQDDQYTSDRMYVYRKAGSGSWKKVKTYKVKKSDYLFTYVDKNVKAGSSYKYRVKARTTFRVKGRKKTMYSPYSEVITLTALNTRGRVSCAYGEATPQAAEMPVIETELTMDQYNYETVIDFGNGGAGAAVDDFVCEPAETVYDIVSYKLPDSEWHEAKGTVILKPGDSISLRMMLREGQPLIDFTKDRRLAIYNISYNGQSGYMMSVYPMTNRGFIYFADEEWG